MSARLHDSVVAKIVAQSRRETDPEYLEGRAQAGLRADPGSQEYRRAVEDLNRAIRWRTIRSNLAGWLADLEAGGAESGSLLVLPPPKGSVTEAVVQVCLQWIPRLGGLDGREAVVRLLASAPHGFDGVPLAKLYDNEPMEHIRFAIGNSIAWGPGYGITDWIIVRLRDAIGDRGRHMLAVAAAKLGDPRIVNPILLRCFTEMPVFAAMGLAISGGEEELDALRCMPASANREVQRQVEQELRRLERRLNRPPRRKRK
jgi:hypothetical protein